MEYYVLEALCRMEQYDAARSRMLQRYDANIKEDYSTLWELWKKSDGTRNHAWSGGPLVIMSKYFAGIRPVDAGYAAFTIKPQMTTLQHIHCVVPSVKGYIRVTEQQTEDAFVLDATIPKDATALLYIPYADGEIIKLNDRVIYQNNAFAESDNIDFVAAEDGYIVFSTTPSAEQSFRFEAIH